jgi:hypothetical protein
MTKTIDGIDFPDDMSDEDIAKALSGQTVGNNASGDNSWRGAVSDYLGKTFSRENLLSTLSNVGSNTNAELRAFNRGMTRGAWDNIVGGVKSLNIPGVTQLIGPGSPAEERAKTEEAKKSLFLHGSIPETAGGMVPAALQTVFAPSTVPTSFAGSVGTGAVQAGIQAEMDRKDPLSVGVDMTTGGAFGGLLHGATKLLGPKAPIRPNTAADDMNKMSQAEWDQIKDYAYPRQALDEINRASNEDVGFSVTNRPTGTPMTDTEVDKPSAEFYKKFGERFNIVRPGKNTPGTPGTPIPLSEVDKWRNDAKSVGSDYTGIISDRLEDLMQGGPTIKLSKLGEQAPARTPEIDQANTDDAYQGILAARKAQARTDAVRALDAAQQTGTNLPIKKLLRDPELDPGVQEVMRQANKGTFTSNTMDRLNRQGPNLARIATAPVAGWLGLEGMPKEALNAGVTGFGAAPAANMLTQPLADAARARMTFPGY